MFPSAQFLHIHSPSPPPSYLSANQAGVSKAEILSITVNTLTFNGLHMGAVPSPVLQVALCVY